MTEVRVSRTQMEYNRRDTNKEPPRLKPRMFRLLSFIEKTVV